MWSIMHSLINTGSSNSMDGFEYSSHLSIGFMVLTCNPGNQKTKAGGL